MSDESKAGEPRKDVEQSGGENTASPKESQPEAPAGRMIAPRPTNVQPAPIHSNHSTKAEKYSIEWWKPRIEILGIFGGVIGVVFLICQYGQMVKTTQIATGQLNAMQRQSDEMEGQLNEMKRTRSLDERAWVTADMIETVPDGTNVYFKVTVKNTGKTPAINLVIWLWDGIDLNTATNFDRTNIIETAGIVSPNSTSALDTSSFPVHTNICQFINSGTIHLYIFGIVRYDDIFKIHHWTHFCWEAMNDFSAFQGIGAGNSCDDVETNQIN